MTQPDYPTMADTESALFFQPDYSRPVLTFDLFPTQWNFLPHEVHWHMVVITIVLRQTPLRSFQED
jgi:hypothetical protein